MSRYQFSAAERYAVYVTHGERCYLCRHPVDLKTMQVDHIIPEHLEDTPAKLAKVKRDLGRPMSFDLNSFENWLPSCGSCNNRKRELVFEPSPLVQVELQRAAARAEDARKTASEVVSRQKVQKALNVLERAHASAELDEDTRAQLRPLVEFVVERRSQEAVGQPVRLTPLYEVLSDDGLRQVVRGPHGVGARPSGPSVDPSWNCPTCGSIAAWNGARCVICGQMDDD